tara:strand:+ start:9810 stop:11060 length:1251 start_codon:yes stop_codon:yes gene_type:complete
MLDRKKILINAYACGPHWGSEIGMGWNWVINLSNYCELTVITEKGFQSEIEKVLPLLTIKYQPSFHYIDIGERGRLLFWKQGSFAFYTHYRKWQKKAYVLAKKLVADNKYDLVHQLNMIGYREPGYLWKIENLPFIIGPVGGYEQFPISFLSMLDMRDLLFAIARNFINYFQRNCLTRPKKAYRRSSYIIVATPKGLNPILKYKSNDVVIIPETGAYKLLDIVDNKEFLESKPFTITWVGKLHGTKALSLALKAISKSKYKNQLIFNIIGYGPNYKKYKKLASDLKLKNIVWHGKTENVKVKDIIANSHLFFFTSILEATSTVIFEALERNVPVLCHNTCGFGYVIDETCGIKIPLINPKESINQFSYEIDKIIENPKKLSQLKKGCRAKIESYFWDTKASKMNEIYNECLNYFEK